jgi:hypothetical protein
VVEISNPRWQLTAVCPVCEQGSALTLVICPACGYLAVRCEEEGSFFPDPRSLEATQESEPTCPRCHRTEADSFVPATDVQIREEGFRSGEYE